MIPGCSQPQGYALYSGNGGGGGGGGVCEHGDPWNPATIQRVMLIYIARHPAAQSLMNMEERHTL